MEAVYSKVILSFLKRVKEQLHKILINEVHALVKREYFTLDGYCLYPLKIVVFEHPKTLGYFDSDILEIGINKMLMYPQNIQHLDDVIRHELAHYLTWIETKKYGHRVDFRNTCKKYGWKHDVSSAVLEMKGNYTSNSGILNKIRKLLALSQSSNEHEAEQATLKSRALLLKHNLEQIETEEEDMIVKRVLKQTRNSVKLQVIGEILATFFVKPVFNRGEKFVYLELFGKRNNVIIAEYVAIFLDNELELMWNIKRQKNTKLKGMACKNSFFRGLAQGFCNKLEKECKHSDKLMIIETNLENKMKMAYPNLRNTRSRYRHCKESEDLGRDAGTKMNIRPGVNKENYQTLESVKYISTK